MAIKNLDEAQERWQSLEQDWYNLVFGEHDTPDFEEKITDLISQWEALSGFYLEYNSNSTDSLLMQIHILSILSGENDKKLARANLAFGQVASLENISRSRNVFKHPDVQRLYKDLHQEVYTEIHVLCNTLNEMEKFHRELPKPDGYEAPREWNPEP